MIERDIIWLPAYRPSASHIISAVAQRRGLTVDDLKGERRTKPIAHARQEAMWELRRRTKLSLPQIAAKLNRKDHTTALHGIRAHAARLAEAQGRAA